MSNEALKDLELVLSMLDSANQNSEIEYAVYSEVHDVIALAMNALEAAERDKREAQAEALEAFAARCDSDWGEFSYIDASGLIGYATVPEMARERAAEIREGRA